MLQRLLNDQSQSGVGSGGQRLAAIVRDVHRAELAALEKAGQSFDIWSLRFPTDKKRHPLHDQIKAKVRYLPEYLHQEPLRVLRGWREARKQPGYRAARKTWLKDLKRDFTRNRIRRFGQACVLAAELPAETRGLYAHFLHTPSSVARYAA